MNTILVHSMAVQCIDIHWQRCVGIASAMWRLLKLHHGGDVDQKRCTLLPHLYAPIRVLCDPVHYINLLVVVVVVVVLVVVVVVVVLRQSIFGYIP